MSSTSPPPGGPHHRDPVQSVTDAPSSAADDRGDRARRYLTAMGLRGVCFVLAIVTSGWLRWTFVAAAVVLPYIAVVLANAVGPGTSGTVTTVDPRSKETRALEGTIDVTPLRGEVVPEDRSDADDERDPRHQRPA